MITPILCEDVFELNDNLQYNVDNEVIIIDDLFKHYDQITNIIYNANVEAWKYSPQSANFIDYYDCRMRFSNYFPIHTKIEKRLGTLANIITNVFGNEYAFQQTFDFNYFRHKIQGVSGNLQLYPHYDMDNLNIIVYLDKDSNGGTALYKNVEPWDNKEEVYTLCDVSNLEIEHIIPAKPNRCAIFSGKRLHNAYIYDHDVYYHNWRINLVNFAIPKENYYGR